jgi:hypothetical protein
VRRGPVMVDSCPGFVVDLAGEFGICKHCGKHRSQHDKAGDGGGGPEETGTCGQTNHPDAALDAGVLDHTTTQHVEVRVRKLEDDKRRLQEQVVRLTQANADCVRRDTTAESERTRMLAREKLAAEERTAAAIAELQRAKDRARDCEGQALLREQLLSDKVKQQAAAMGELHAAVLAQKATTDHLAFPLYWDAFPEGQVHLEVELIGAAAGTELAVERDRVLQRFQAQGAPSVAVSLKRIQDIPFWQRYAAHREHLRLKRGNANERGAPETGCNHLYHGAKQNVQAVIDTAWPNGTIQSSGWRPSGHVDTRAGVLLMWQWLRTDSSSLCVPSIRGHSRCGSIMRLFRERWRSLCLLGGLCHLHRISDSVVKNTTTYLP